MHGLQTCDGDNTPKSVGKFGLVLRSNGKIMVSKNV